MPKRYNIEIMEHHGHNIVAVGHLFSGCNIRMIYVSYEAHVSDEFLDVRSDGKRKAIVKSSSPSGWIAKVTAASKYYPGAFGRIYIPDNVGIIAYGIGHINKSHLWEEKLLLIPDNTRLLIQPRRGIKYTIHFGYDKVTISK